MKLVLFNMANIDDWQKGIVNRNFFIARELMQRSCVEQVVLVDFLAIRSVKKMFGKKRSWSYLISWLKGLSKRKKMYGFFHYTAPLPPDLFPQTSSSNLVFKGIGAPRFAKQSLWQLQKLLKEQGFTKNNTLLWSYNAFLPEVFDLEAKQKVFDTVDNWAKHPSYIDDAELLEQNYRKIDCRADQVFTVSPTLCSLFSQAACEWVGNGIDVELFALPTPQPKSDTVKIGYVGTIQERVDFDLIEQLVKDHPEKEFFFAGPVWSGVLKEVETLKQRYRQVNFLGRLAYKEVPDFLTGMDLAIIPHKQDAFLSSMNAMKLYDYLAAGKPVIATPGAGTEQFAELICICQDKVSFSNEIDKQLALDSKQAQEKRKTAIKQFAWNKRVDAMLSKLDLSC